MLYDKDIREPLFEYLEELYGQVRIIEEKTMGRSRADIVMVTPEDLVGIEIKSDADTYVRLQSQVKDYDRFFDYNLVVVGSSHGLHIEEHVPSYWGIITVEQGEEAPDFYFLRKPQPNPGAEWKHKLKILWRPELARVQEHFQLPKYKEKSKQFVIDKICDKIGTKIIETELKKAVSEQLMERDYTAIADELKEYRKGELRKQLEKETDAIRRLEMMVEMSPKRLAYKTLKKRGGRKIKGKRR